MQRCFSADVQYALHARARSKIARRFRRIPARFFSALTPFPSSFSFYRQFYYFDFRQAIPRMRMQFCLLSSSSQHPLPCPRRQPRFRPLLGHCFKVCLVFFQAISDPSLSLCECCYVEGNNDSVSCSCMRLVCDRNLATFNLFW